ncbi:MAG: thioredoxin domain-containing protein, partial [Bacteroidota bacterium]|nr:thioredoxin domain-containing protein [Bacteroidota bacterium]
MQNQKYTNELIHETSPYLLQHAHNPVNWQPWGKKALSQAKSENKLLLISIGYSACHWCHVMEHESFEDTEVAQVMNQHFVCIKIDREERPDIDHIYMTAVQLLTGRGGWPLNCIALPDG